MFPISPSGSRQALIFSNLKSKVGARTQRDRFG